MAEIISVTPQTGAVRHIAVSTIAQVVTNGSTGSLITFKSGMNLPSSIDVQEAPADIETAANA